MRKSYRTEEDLLGALEIHEACLHGVHTERALANFPLARQAVHPTLIHAFGWVKLACALTNRSLGAWAGDDPKFAAIERACREMAQGLLDEHLVVDRLQGGAGTSTNMNANEVLANRALVLLGEKPGRYSRVHPLDDINLHQSTNDTYPTALKLAAILLLHQLETQVIALQESFQAAERRFADVVKVGRTQLQDAVLITLGREMGAYAEAMNRDRWRIYKCEERLRVVNLGGTAIGTGLAAPRDYIFRVVDVLREECGIPFARAENLVENTQNADVFVEVSGILKAHAVSLLKICTDLRLLASGPEAGLGEIRLPGRQAGSSIMPGKVNPVIPEAASQVAMLVLGHDQTIAMACAAGNLELNAFLPLVAHCLLDSLDFLARACSILRTHCVDGIEADREKCWSHVEGTTAMATALLPALGYEKVCELAVSAGKEKRSVKDLVLGEKLLTAKEYEDLVSAEAVTRLGMPK